MEIELKYSLNSDDEIEKIFKSVAKKYGKSKTYSEKDMHAIYFSTISGLPDEFKDLNVTGRSALRFRKENDEYVLTLKWDGKVNENGLHEREEVNIPTDQEFINRCNLKKDVEMKFLRREIELSTGKSTSILSIDDGYIFGPKNERILEMEIELVEGDKEDLENIGKEISKEFNLKPLLKSKYERGYILNNGLTKSMI